MRTGERSQCSFWLLGCWWLFHIFFQFQATPWLSYRLHHLMSACGAIGCQTTFFLLCLQGGPYETWWCSYCSMLPSLPACSSNMRWPPVTLCWQLVCSDSWLVKLLAADSFLLCVPFHLFVVTIIPSKLHSRNQMPPEASVSVFRSSAMIVTSLLSAPDLPPHAAIIQFFLPANVTRNMSYQLLFVLLKLDYVHILQFRGPWTVWVCVYFISLKKCVEILRWSVFVKMIKMLNPR